MGSEIVESANLGIELIYPRISKNSNGKRIVDPNGVSKNSSVSAGDVFLKFRDFLKKLGLLFKLEKLQNVRFGEQKVIDSEDFTKLSSETNDLWQKLEKGLVFQDPSHQADLISKMDKWIDYFTSIVSLDSLLLQPTKTASTVVSRFQRKEEDGGTEEEEEEWDFKLRVYSLGHMWKGIDSAPISPPSWINLRDICEKLFRKRLISCILHPGKEATVIAFCGLESGVATTLAEEVYHDYLVRQHFHCIAWARVGDDPNPGRIIKDLLISLTCHRWEVLNIYLGISAFYMPPMLYAYLKDKRFLLVLEDVRDMNLFDALCYSFPLLSVTGNRLLLTTPRDQDEVVQPLKYLIERLHAEIFTH
ncbi:OLC1v1030609C1 [Oldenlandia corymbosa var. corymbosa]|uniref:OLC1v1030609C1 n=1 Tax=Oldenlandia corymbosa var. corymbosa TaxID=529605 RepID=A0AAV1CH75_OLDCO|nr:OLC1v1030609C1 [Oldenlandia corymbosa var. corymbosa]